MVTATTGDARAGEAGFTLVELLVAATLMLVVVAGSLTALTSLQRTQRDASDRVAKLARAQTAMERMTRELRQAATVGSTSPTTVTASTWVHVGGSATATQKNVTYACDTVTGTPTTRTCSRTVDGVKTTLLSGVTNSDIFSYSSSIEPNYVGVKLTVRLDDGNGVTVADGVDLRNDT